MPDKQTYQVLNHNMEDAATGEEYRLEVRTDECGLCVEIIRTSDKEGEITVQCVSIDVDTGECVVGVGIDDKTVVSRKDLSL